MLDTCLTSWPTQGQSSNANIRYFRCREPSHKAIKCRNSTTQKGENLLINEDDTEDIESMGEPIYDEDGEEGVILHEDGNETLVIRKSFLTLKEDSSKNWL